MSKLSRNSTLTSAAPPQRSLRRQRGFTQGWRQVAYNALLWRDGKVDLDKLARIQPNWDNPATPTPQAAADEAWTEVLTLSPDADIPGMREQFMCHWQYAELAEPGKTSWNLEPWRPEVSPDQMVAAHCNPGGTEEPF